MSGSIRTAWPGNQRPHVAPEGAERAGLLHHGAVLLGNEDGDNVLHPMHIHTGNTFMDWFRRGSPFC